jgi:hypothetical protein
MAVSNPTPPPPPRLIGDPKADVAAIAQWANDFYKAAVVSGYFLNNEEESQAGEFDPNTLPDPATATVAQAQKTANEAYALAFAANALAVQTKNWVIGTLTISGAATSAASTLTGANEQPDANYRILAVPESSVGSPGIGAFVPVGISAKTAAGFTLNVQAAPGIGNSVTFTIFLLRDIT